MAEYIVPGGGIVNDTNEGFEIIIPGFGIYQEQEPEGGALALNRGYLNTSIRTGT